MMPNSVVKLFVVVMALPRTNAAVYMQQRGAHEIAVDSQLGLDFLAEAPDFTRVKAKPLAKINVESQSDVSVKSVAFEGATSLMISADLKTKSLRLIPASSADTSQESEIQVAWVHYNNTVKKNGWAYLSVGATKDTRISRDLKMYAAGFLEGVVSAQQIRDFQHNANALISQDEGRHHAMGNIRALFEKEVNTIVNLSSMHIGASLSESNAPADPWWRQARYALLQSWGMLDGYNRQVEKVKGNAMSMVDLLVLNSDGETPELETAYDMEEFVLRQSQRGDSDDTDSKDSFLQRRVRHDDSSAFHSRSFRSRKDEIKALNDKVWRKIKRATGRCSALVRLTKNNEDLMVGHTTFSDYSEMNRIYKFYDLPVGDDVAQKVSFSSYPGVAGSTDDYYLIDSGLVVTETTISMLTDEPYDKLDDNGTMVPDFMRIMISNRLAKSGLEWTNLMKKSATGTYSSQWMVTDYNLFKKGQPLQNGTLYVIEQIPGISHIQDATPFLQSHGFWSSENRAWFTDVRDAIGASEAEEAHGALFSADKNPRANIFKASAPKVQTLMDMREEMQRNRWPYEVDGGDANTPDHAIAARGDLDKASPVPNGAVDSKVTNFCLAKRLQCDAISGPTHSTQKPFKWTDDKGKQLYPDAPHDGMPDLWNFDWVRMTSFGEELAPTSDC
jgi:hypothetical protein